MDTTLITIVISIISLLITILVAYHIAFRQGIFHNAKLFATFGPLLEDVKNQKPRWAILLGLKELNVDYYLAIIPISIENRSDIALRNILIQIIIDQDFDVSKFKFIKNNDVTINYNIKRGVKSIQEKIIIEYEIPLLTPRTPLFLEELIAIKKTKFEKNKTKFEREILKDSDQNYIIERFSCDIWAENHKPFKFKTWLISTPSQNIDQLIKRTRWPIFNLLNHDCPKLFGNVYTLKPYPWAKRSSKVFPPCKHFFMYMQPKFFELEEMKVAVHESEETIYEFGEFDLEYNENENFRYA